MKPIIIIPARMASTRLPGKPLADIAGRAMILRVCDTARNADIGPVVVAAGDQEIFDAVTAAGFQCAMTDPELPSGTDRIYAAINELDPDGDYDVVVNLQGDAPGLDPAHTRAVLTPLKHDPDTDIATLAVATNDPAKAANPNIVKCIIAKNPAHDFGRALYFTRANAPSGDGPIHHHAGIYAYRRKALERFCALPVSPLEAREQLEQLRALENNMTISVQLIDQMPSSVDTQEDLEEVRKLFDQSV
ncbi:MAG: 3-deoxy-manno-octulosonate cytidylyltransferase [Hyphococcus sp.]|nr:MAG: 3-deoxy-manno-octulosonate cytidylyltransferase [Marinicaulis sp.]